MFKLYLFENEADLLDKVDKISNIIIATFTLMFSIYIWHISNHKEKKIGHTSRKVDFLKSIVLDNNLIYFFQFHDQILTFLESFKGRIISDSDRTTISVLMIDELSKYRLRFYDLILPIDRKLYETLKNSSDTLIDDLTNKIFDITIDHFSAPNFEGSISNLIIETRNKSLEAIIFVE
ncbi:hypothetical protein [Flavobacterium sp. GNP001]